MSTEKEAPESKEVKTVGNGLYTAPGGVIPTIADVEAGVSE